MGNTPLGLNREEKRAQGQEKKAKPLHLTPLLYEFNFGDCILNKPKWLKKGLVYEPYPEGDGLYTLLALGILFSRFSSVVVFAQHLAIFFCCFSSIMPRFYVVSLHFI